MTARCVSVCDEKVAVAQQCYDLVEQHIARLDKDLRVFDQALAEKEAAAAPRARAAARRGGRRRGFGVARARAPTAGASPGLQTRMSPSTACATACRSGR